MLSLKHSLLSRQLRTPMINPIAVMLRVQMLSQYPMRFKHFGEKRRKAKCFKWKKYPCVPSFMQAVKADPFDYPLQTKEQVKAQIIEEPMFEMVVRREFNNRTGMPLDYPQDGKMLADETPTAKFNIHKMPMSFLQKERLIFLLGSRYDPKTGDFKVKCKMYPTYEQNYKKLQAIVRELFIEALRAPNNDISLIRDPYKRDREKRKLGRTKAERDEKLAEMEKHKQDAHKLYQEEGKYLRFEQFRQKIADGLKKEAEMAPPTKQQEKEMFDMFLKDSGM